MLLLLSMETVFSISAARISLQYSVLISNQYSREKRVEYVMTFHDTCVYLTLREMRVDFLTKIISYLCQYFI